MQSQLAFHRKHPWKLALPLSLKQPPPPTSKPSAKPYVHKTAQAADEAWQQTVEGHDGPAVTSSTVSELEHSSSASQDDDDDDLDFSLAPQKSRLGAPQLQAFSQLSDRTRFRRPENTPFQVCLASSGDTTKTCATHVPHKWLYHLDARAGSVLTPHDFITNVQKRAFTVAPLSGQQMGDRIQPQRPDSPPPSESSCDVSSAT